MSREEPSEDRKLFAKSWFTRSVSSITFQNASAEAVPDGVSSGISVSKEGVVESGAIFPSLRQLSMRRSMASGEIKSESVAGSPSMTPKNITPLTPLTPLKWKSNPREQEEEEKAMERSRLGLAVPISTMHEEYPGGMPAASEGAAEGQQQGSPVAGAAGHDGTNPADELSTKVQGGNTDENVSLESLEGPDRKPSSGDDVMTMTIEFLRARLLSERSASKTAKLRIQQLAKKVSELEEKLDQAVEDKKKAEVSAEEAFMNLNLIETSNQATNRTTGEVSDTSISTSTKGSPLLRSRAAREDTKYLQQDVSSSKDLSRTNSYGSSVEDRDFSIKRQLSETVNKTEELTSEQGRPGVRPAPQNMSERSQELPRNQESRAVIESRLRNMWSKISEDMTALAEERTEDVVREELMSWLGRVPTVLQNIMPKELASPTHDVDLRSESERIELQSVPRQTVESQPGLSPETVQVKGQLQTKATRAALLHEQFTAQENVQREWERNYQESQRQVEQLKGGNLDDNSSPNASAGHRELQHADNRHGPNGVVDNSSFLGPHHSRLGKSKSNLDLSTRSNGYNLDMNSPHRHEPYDELVPRNRERPRRQGAEDRHYDPMYQNTAAHGHVALDPTYSNHSRIHQDRSGAPSILAEDGYRSSKPDFRAGESSWDDRDRGNSGRQQQAQPRHGDGNGRMEKDYYRVSEIEESFSSSQPEKTHGHRHRRSHSDNYDWPAVEDYGLLNPQPELSPGLGRRQSYTGYPAAVADDPRRTSFDKPPGSYDDLRCVDERMYGADERRRNSFPATKADNAPGQVHSTQTSRNGHSNAEPTLTLGYGPAYDAPPREDSPVQQSPKAGLNRNISDVLRALQLAKAKIQNGGAGLKEQRSTREQVSQSMKAGYGMEPSAQYMQGSYR